MEHPKSLLEEIPSSPSYKHKKTKKTKTSENSSTPSTHKMEKKKKEIDTQNFEISQENSKDDLTLSHENGSTNGSLAETQEDDDGLSSSLLTLKIKDESEVDKKKFIKHDKHEDSDEEKKTKSAKGFSTDSPESESPNNYSGPTLVELLEKSQEQTLSEEDENEEQSDTSSDTAETMKPKRPTLLKEPEFNENFLLDILLTLRTCALGAMKKTFEDVNERDFTTSVQYKISRTGLQKRFVIKDFAPKVFRNLRHQFRISTEDYLHSWSKTNLTKEKTQGKSSSMFIFSEDRRFILKTITKAESKSLRDLMVSYYQHMVANPDSLIVKFIGHHRMSVKGKPLYFIVLGNVFFSTKTIHEMYDLKGSSVGRETDNAKDANVVLKDNDFIAKKRKLVLSASVRNMLMKQIEEDCKLLATHDLMDYSLLVGVHRLNEPNGSQPAKLDQISPGFSRSSRTVLKRVPTLVFFCEEVQETNPKGKVNFLSIRSLPRRKSFSLPNELRNSNQSNTIQKVAGGIPSFGQDGIITEYYYVGIIDILQKYDSKKKLAHIAKSFRYTKEELSTVNPNFYSSRFKAFIAKAIESPAFSSDSSSNFESSLVSTIGSQESKDKEEGKLGEEQL